MHSSLADFHPVIARWFHQAFKKPTPPQEQGWPAIAAGHHVLLLAPTGSGKTLAAFLNCLDWLYKKADAGICLRGGVRILYISPLKALNNDIQKNLQRPLRELAVTAETRGYGVPDIYTAVRTGDTPAPERQRMRRNPPQILMTTPESLFLMTSSKAREMLRTVQFVIIDEIHTLFPEKRGAHLSLTLERLQHVVGEIPFQRIGLSATMRPLEEVARFLGGHRRDYDLKIVLPTPDLAVLPERTIWPAVYRTLHCMIGEHKTTLVFVNSRRLAEQITANLNRLASAEIACTHHGSLAKEMRLEAEDKLKTGRIPCIVATGSLELGIDVGHIELVVQVESPKAVARGMQRVGRAGHVLDLPSKGRLIPKTRMDLLENAIMMQHMLEADVEASRAPRNCLDILSQQLVAMATEQDWKPEDMFALVRRSYSFSDLQWEDFQGVLQMLAGIYETPDYVQLRPRLHWDRNTNTVSSDPYGVRLVYSNSGTIPQRGYFGVYMGDSNVRLGDLEEEFVYERRLGDRFRLGTSVWRVEEIRQDRVIVSRAKNQEANVPFWKGAGIARSWDLGRKMGRFLRSAEEELERDQFPQWLDSTAHIDDPALVDNLQRFLERQKRVCGYLPTDRQLVVEDFLDETGQWYVLLHSPFGARIHTLLGLLVQNQVQSRQGIVMEAVPGDNGVLFHAPGSEQPPQISWDDLTRGKWEETAARLLSETSLFGITFRHCAQRSLVLSLSGYGRRRTPLWLSRLKASDLLQIVSAYSDFPLVKETYREILQDYFPMDQLRELLHSIGREGIAIHRVRTEAPSPFAQEHLFLFEASQMYGDDMPRKETTSRLVHRDRDTIRRLVGQKSYHQQLRPDVIAQVEAEMQGRDALQYHPTAGRVQYWLERVGDLKPNQISSELQPFVDQLIAIGAAKLIELHNREFVIASLYRERYLNRRYDEFIWNFFLCPRPLRRVGYCRPLWHTSVDSRK